MKTYDVWCSVNIPLVVPVEEPDENSATLKIEHMFTRGELTNLIIMQLLDGQGELSIDEAREFNQ